MASISYQFSSLHHRIFQPETIPETHDSAPRVVQIDLTISFNVRFILHDCITASFTNYSSITTNALSSQVTHRFDLDVLKNQDQARQVLAPMLTRLRIINPTSLSFQIVIDKIIEHGLRIGNSTSNRGHKVLPLRVEFFREVMIHVNREGVSINRALLESESEFEASNYGMVPAKESSVREMLKRVRLEGGDKEDCMICLDQLTVKSDAFQMPCSHTFHDNCIETWLKQSHYCPICRFEMPT
ncbi:hypothetical protein REPUB_Repub01dG0010600 [Reevesia pubescens]